MDYTSTLPFPTRRHQPALRNNLLRTATAIPQAEPSAAPSQGVLDRLRQFARAYCPVNVGGTNFSGIVLN